MKISLVILASATGLAILAEIALRLILGLGNPPLYIPEPEIGYLLAPNQKLRRSGNVIETNQYSMRNQQLEPKLANQTRVMLLGDSVVNGSWWTDQTQTLSSLLAQKLQSAIDTVEVLNVSANSWAPRNQLAYLKSFGLFDADALVLVINTDDLFAIEPTSFVVGKSPNYPEKAPALALIEGYRLFIAQPQSIPELEQLKQRKDNRLSQNLAAIGEIKAIAEASDTQFILALTPLLREFKSSLSDKELEARMRLEELTRTEEINYIDFLTIWADFPQPEFLYRDHIHPTPQGNSKIAEEIRLRLVERSLKN